MLACWASVNRSRCDTALDGLLRVLDRVARVLLHLPDWCARTYPGSRNVVHRVGGLGGDQGEGLVQGVPRPGDHALVEPLPQVHGAHGVAGDGHPVVADLHDQTGHQAERPAPGLTVGDHEPGEHHRVVRAGRAGERAAVPGQQRGGQDADLLADDPHVHPPLGQVAPVDPHRHPGLPDTIEGGQQDVEVVDDLVTVGQERPRRPSLPFSPRRQRSRNRRSSPASQPFTFASYRSGFCSRIFRR